MCKRSNALSLPVLIARVSLIALIFNAHRNTRRQIVRMHDRGGNKTNSLSSSVFGRPGGIGGEPVPDPIPNSAVKLPCADGTKSQGLEE